MQHLSIYTVAIKFSWKNEKIITICQCKLHSSPGFNCPVSGDSWNGGSTNHLNPVCSLLGTQNVHSQLSKFSTFLNSSDDLQPCFTQNYERGNWIGRCAGQHKVSGVGHDEESPLAETPGMCLPYPESLQCLHTHTGKSRARKMNICKSSHAYNISHYLL